jgi:hypothetical protein
VSGNVANATVALVVSQAAQPNITSVGTLTGLYASGNISTATYFSGGGNALSNVQGSSVSGNVANATVALVVSQATQPNITSVGTLTGLYASGNISTATYFSGNGNALSNIQGSSVSGNVANANVALVVSQAAQPNITSVGLLSNLAVSNSLTTMNVFVTGKLNVQGTSNLWVANIANIYTTNIVGFVGSQWSGTIGNPLYYAQQVGIGTASAPPASGPTLWVAGNVYASNALTTTNVIASNVLVAPGLPSSIVQGSNVVVFSNTSGSANVFVINSSSQVGIGTTNPGFPLDVRSDPSGNGGPNNVLLNLNSGWNFGGGANTVMRLTRYNYGGQISGGVVASIGPLMTFSLYQNGSIIDIMSLGNANEAGVGIGTTNPRYKLDVIGDARFSNVVTTNLYSANALTTTNLFANTMTLTNAEASITGNLYVSNALTTTNIFTAGFTANASNMTFNFDTVSIPYLFTTTLNVSSTSNVLTQTVVGSPGETSLYVSGNAYVSNALSTTDAFLTGALNVQGTSNLSVANIANIYTTNIVGFVGSQWTGSSGSPIYYVPQVGVGTSVTTANLTVSGNLYVSNSIQTGNLILGGVTSGGFLRAQGASNVTSVSTIPIGSGGTNQTSYGTTGGVIYYDGTRFQAATGITASTASTLNVTTANITTLQTSSFIPSASGLFMNLNSTYTLTSTSNWLGSIAGTITSNLYTLFAPLPGITGWSAFGSSSCVNQPTANGGIRFNQPGPYMITTVISADSGIKTIALSSNLGNTVDIHSNVTNVWQYCYRFPFGDVNPWPVTIPVNVTNTSQYYYIDFETTNQTDNIHQTAYTNAASQAFTGSYVIIRPV